MNCTAVTRVRDGTNLTYQYEFHPFFKRVEGVYGPNASNDLNWRGTRCDLDDYANVRTALVADFEALESSSSFEFAKLVQSFDSNRHLTNWAFAYRAEPSNCWSYSWNPSNQTLDAMSDPEGSQVLFEYTNGLLSRRRLVVSTNQTLDTTFSYSTNGLLVAVTNANGHWVQYVRGGCCPEGIIPEAGPRVILNYDELRHLTGIELPGESGTRTITLNPDELGRVCSVQYPDNLTAYFSYDGLGNLLTNVDRAGRSTRFTYGPGGKLASVTRALQNGGSNQDVTISLDYDSQMNALEITDPLGRAVESYVLDDEDRPVKITNVESQEMTVAYALKNYVESITRFDGTGVGIEYDTDGQLSKVHFPGETLQLTYYRNNLLKTAANALGTISNSYDAVNRLISSSTPVVSGYVSYAYLPAGQVSSVVSVAGTTVYGYNAGERVSSVQGPGPSVQFTYNTNNGLVSTMTYPNGVQAAYSYDVMDRITGITWSQSGTNTLKSFQYGYNSADVITDVVYETGETSVYGYDSLDRLTGERRVNPQGETMWESGYSYDLAGNRLTKTRDGMTVSYSYGSGDRLTSWVASATGALNGVLDVVGNSSETNGTNPQWGERTVNGQTAQVSGTNFWAYEVPVAGGTQQQIVAAIGDMAGNVGRTTNFVNMRVATNGSYQSDAAGCVTNIQYTGLGFTNSLGLSWNSQYQLTSVRTNGGVAEAYQYDALGRRISIASGGITNYLVYDGIHCIAEVDSSGVLQRAYTYSPGIDNILSMTVYGATTSVYFCLKDHLGTVHALTDTNGAIVESYRYDAWGRVLGIYDGAGLPIANQQSAIGNRFLFQGREYSWATGLYFFRARYYDPVTGRWLSKDPIGISGGLNQFVFCANNPVNLWDHLGLCEDGESYLRTYLSSVSATPPWGWNDLVFHKFDLRHERTDYKSVFYQWRWGTVRSDEMGNVGVGYVFAQTVGILPSAAGAFVWEIMNWEGADAAAGSWIYNAEGMAAAVLDNPVSMLPGGFLLQPASRGFIYALCSP